MTTSVIVPVYNNVELTIAFVSDALRWVRPPDELIIVDNGSTDTTWPFLKAMQKPERALKWAHSDKPLGFSGGNNLGAKMATGDVLIFTSNDVDIFGDFITPVAKTVRDNPRHLIGARLLAFDTGWNTFLDQGKPITIPYLEGWFIAMSREGFNELEGWDEKYFPSDCEDIDLSFTASLMDWQLLAMENLPIAHTNTGQTANKMLGRFENTLKSRERFMRKWGLKPIGEQHA